MHTETTHTDHGRPAQVPADAPAVYLVIGAGTWGKGFTEAQARTAATVKRGQPHIVYRCTDAWTTVDSMGMIHYDRTAALWIEKEATRKR